ncbi:Na+/H+ antiporter NhaC family protein [Acetobacterium bakii]|uniref:Sodium:proton antiporter n=1 Tax=Acetobacterium bakii TaxID=52689 RepID=A0A0L6TXG4_9FIRM|nr:Na+/H+ antiporter NhaC family protein [Acetobacterium bakii]KNZ40959.1 sodium:proton antiporter [Acetobacterium bakii]
METIDVGILSIIPPIIAIALALISKEVISSLLIGILSGSLIYSLATGGGIIEMGTIAFGTMAETVGSPGKFNIILFLALLGALVYVVTQAGGSRAYGKWACTKLKSKRSAQLATSALGAIIFIDDYFNCLTVGTVMKPVTDKYQVSRAKLAYIIDSTAAPVCILAPISSWAAAVGSTLYATGAFPNELGAFVATIPYNLYAILCILMVVIISATDVDFGPMAKYEQIAKETGDLGVVDHESAENMDINDKGTVWDLVIPIGSLIVFSVLAMLHNGGFWAGEGLTLAEAFGNCDASAALVMGGFGALIVTFMLFVPRKLISFKEFMGSIAEGIKTMVPAFIILTLAWTIGTMCQDLLGTGFYIGELVKSSNIPVGLIPAMVFLVSAMLSFSIGTAWGTFGIFIPIVVFICQYAAPELMIVTLSATLAGSVFGDHCSPISDTTILSSTGAGCDHIRHVSTQMIYSLLVAGCSFVGYIVAGFSNGNLFLTLGTAIGLLVIFMIILHRISKDKQEKIRILENKLAKATI